MADIEHSDVTVIRSWYEAGQNGRRFYCKQISMDSATVVTAATYPASAFGMREIVDVGAFLDTENDLPVHATPDATGDNLLLFDADTPAALNAVGVRGVIKGLE